MLARTNRTESAEKSNISFQIIFGIYIPTIGLSRLIINSSTPSVTLILLFPATLISTKSESYVISVINDFFPGDGK